MSCEGWVLRRGVSDWRDFIVRALKNVKVIPTLNSSRETIFLITNVLYENVFDVHHRTCQLSTWRLVRVIKTIGPHYTKALNKFTKLAVLT